MHIAIDARIINSSTGRYVERLLTFLQEIDSSNTYTVLVRKKDLSYWVPQQANFTVKVADFDNYSLTEQTSYKAFLDVLEPDLVHFCMPQQPILYTGNHVTTVHDLTLLKTYNSDKDWLKYHIKQLIGRYVFKRIAKTSSHIITPTRYTRDEYIRYTHIPKDKVSVTYEAADKVSAIEQPYDLPFGKFLLYVGQQSDYKNIKRLGEAHQKLLATYPDLGLVLAGKKNAAALKNEAYFKQQGFTHIIFTDFIPDSQLAWLYSHCAAYVFPSLMEGFGLPGLEAMTYGAPVASSNATCLPEVYGDAAVYFDPLNTDEMAKTIHGILSDSTVRDSLVQKGNEQIKKYSWRRMAEETHAVYMKVLQ